jgi:hypothetical protein
MTLRILAHKQMCSSFLTHTHRHTPHYTHTTHTHIHTPYTHTNTHYTHTPHTHTTYTHHTHTQIHTPHTHTHTHTTHHTHATHTHTHHTHITYTPHTHIYTHHTNHRISCTRAEARSLVFWNMAPTQSTIVYGRFGEILRIPSSRQFKTSNTSLYQKRRKSVKSRIKSYRCNRIYITYQKILV